jgi:hypothetical protein
LCACARNSCLSTCAAIAATLPCQVALGIYATQSLFNHSCVPNVISTYMHDVCTVRTLRPIGKHEQLCSNYGPRFGTQARAVRQQLLAYQYNFDCACVACASDKYACRWLSTHPLHVCADTESLLTVRVCTDCSTIIAAHEDRCSKCDAPVKYAQSEIEDMIIAMNRQLETDTPDMLAIETDINRLRTHVHRLYKLLYTRE